MKCFLLHVLIFTIASLPALAAQKAKIFSEVVDIYSEASFDSDIIAEVRAGETYFISDKTYGAFYRIKLKNGKIGYIVDYEVDIEGKGRIQPKDLDDVIMESERKALLAENADFEDSPDEEEAELFGVARAGPFLQLINFHENTLGSEQVDNLLGVGYKSVDVKSWSVLGVFNAPKYYAEKTGGSASGVKIWADVGFSNPIVMVGNSEIRYAGTLFAHISVLNVNTPTRKYSLQDITAGLALEASWMIKVKNSAIDLAIKYYFDKSAYAGFGLGYLF